MRWKRLATLAIFACGGVSRRVTCSRNPATVPVRSLPRLFAHVWSSWWDVGALRERGAPWRGGEHGQEEVAAGMIEEEERGMSEEEEEKEGWLDSWS